MIKDKEYTYAQIRKLRIAKMAHIPSYFSTGYITQKESRLKRLARIKAGIKPLKAKMYIPKMLGVLPVVVCKKQHNHHIREFN